MQRVDLGAEAEWQWAEGSTANADVFLTYFDKLSREELIGSRQVARPVHRQRADEVPTAHHPPVAAHAHPHGRIETHARRTRSLARTHPALGRATAHGGSAAVERGRCGGLHPRRLAGGGKHRRRVGCPLSVALALRVPSDAENFLCPATFRELEGADFVRRWIPRSFPKGTPLRL